MADIQYVFTSISINDPIQLDTYINTYLGNTILYKSLTYNSGTSTLTVYTGEASLSSTTQTSLSNLFTNYPNPTPNLTSTGIFKILNTYDSTSVTVGSTVISGGLGVGKALQVGGLLTANLGISLANQKITLLATPTAGTDAATKAYVDSAASSAILAGSGLTKTGSTLSVNVDSTSIEIFGNVLRVASGLAGTGLSGGSGSVLSVNASQTQITAVGTLTSLTVSGATSLAGLTAGTTSLGALTGTSATFSSTLGVTGTTSLGVLTAGAFTGTSATFSSTLSVTGTSTLGVLNAGASTLGALTGTSATFSSTLGVTGTTTLGVLSAGASTLGAITGTSATFSSTLGVTGTTTLGVLNAGASTLGAITGTSATFSSTLGVTGTATLGTVNISGITTFSNTTDTASSVTGAVIIAGGVGIAKSLNVGGSLTVSTGLSVNGTRITSVGTPTSASDAATKAYVDAVAQSLSIKNSVIVATTAAGTLATSFAAGQVIDGVTLVIGNRILIKDQTNAVENGIYVVTAGTPTRSTDFASGSTSSGNFTFVDQGTVNNSSGWVVTSDVGSDVVGTNLINLTQFSGAGSIIAGSGIIKSGNTLSVNVDNTSIQISSNALRIGSGAVGTGLSGGAGAAISVNASQTQITAIGTITTGTWNASLITVPYGGTGASSFTAGNVLYGNGSGVLGNTSAFSYVANLLTVPSVSLTATTVSSSVSTGSLVVAGGAGISGAVFIGGTVTSGGLTVSGSSSLAGLSVSGATLFTNTTDSSSVSTGSVIMSGGLAITKTLFANSNIITKGTIQLQGSTSGSVTLAVPATVTTPYTLTLPTAKATSAGQVISSDTSGALSFTSIPTNPISTVYNSTASITGAKIWTATVTTSGGIATVFPTTTGTTGGTALFSTILFSSATATVNTTSPIIVAFTGLRSISGDFKTVIFNVITGINISAAGPTLQAAPNSVSVSVVIIGL